jgi:6-phosphogluconolactonase
MRTWSEWPIAATAAVMLAGCGGGGSGGDSGALRYTIGGSVRGLSGAGLVLEATGAGTVTVSSSGQFQFATALPDGAAYAITVRTQPTNPSQICSISKATASGTVAGANVTNVEVACAANAARFMYVVNHGSNDISGYAIDNATGALTPMSGSPFAAGAGPTWLTIHPGGKFAYATNGDANSISAYTVDATRGVLAPTSDTPTLVTPISTVQSPISPVAIDSSGTVAIVGNPNAPFVGDVQPDNLSVYRIDAASGMLTPAVDSPLSTGAPFPDFVATDPTGKFAYAFNYINRVGVGGLSIASLAIDSNAGTLAAVNRSPFGPFQPYPQCYGLAPNGKFAYEGSIGDGLQSFILDGTTGAVTAGGSSTFKATTCAVDASSRFMYVSDGSAIAGYTVDSMSGALRTIGGTPVTLSDPYTLLGVRIDLSGKFLYVTRKDAIYAFAIDSSSGELTAVSGSPFTVASSTDRFATPIAIDPSGRFAYVPSRTSSNLYALSIDPFTGALTPVAGSPFAAGASPGAISFLN